MMIPDQQLLFRFNDAQADATLHTYFSSVEVKTYTSSLTLHPAILLYNLN